MFNLKTNKFLVFSKFIQNYHPLHQTSIHRHMWQFAYSMINRIDIDRQSVVSADRLCAEWILRHGGRVQLSDDPDGIIDDRSKLPVHMSKDIRLKAIDASGSTIMNVGFEHLLGCEDIEQIRLHNCKYLENDALAKLSYVRNTLKELEISSCPKIQRTGLLTLFCLNNLKRLIVYNCPKVDITEDLKLRLRMSMPSCEINIYE